MPRSKRDKVKVEWNKHSNKEQSREHNKKVRTDGKKEIKKELNEKNTNTSISDDGLCD